MIEYYNDKLFAQMERFYAGMLHEVCFCSCKRIYTRIYYYVTVEEKVCLESYVNGVVSKCQDIFDRFRKTVVDYNIFIQLY